jgi:acyl-CoA thioesterase I
MTTAERCRLARMSIRDRYGCALPALVAILALAVLAVPTRAAEINIVALGASNTYGKGVARAEAFPAQLEAMLKAKGLDASVSNAGINGDTTAGMLDRLAAATPAGTQIVILQPGGNDRRQGLGENRAAAIAAILDRLQGRNIQVIMLDRMLAGMWRHMQPDGEHLTPEGYRLIAERLLPQVIEAIGRK